MSKMDNSRKLGDELVSKLGIKNCYFQPPGSEKITYPCIIFKFETENRIPFTHINISSYKGNSLRYICSPCCACYIPFEIGNKK